MAKFNLSLSSRVTCGKSQILARGVFSHDLIFRFKTGVFVTPELFCDGEIYTTNKALQAEMKKATASINAFESRVSNVIAEAQKAKMRGRFEEPITQAWVERTLSLTNIDLAEASFNEIMDALNELQKNENAVAIEKQKDERSDIFQYIEDYARSKDLSAVRKKSFIVLARTLLRFQYYVQNTTSTRNYKVDYDTMTLKDVDSFREFLHNEYIYVKNMPKVFERINEKVNARYPVKEEKSVLQRSNNYIIDVLKKLGSVFKWLQERGITTNNPMVNVKKEVAKYGTPFFITEDEILSIASFDLSSRPRLIVHRDIFVFQCLTGARYGDLSRIEPTNITNGVMCYYPSKTAKSSGSMAIVPLDEMALALIEKYKGQDKNGRIFPFPAPNTYNEQIKVIFTLCGITRNVMVKNPDTGKEEAKPINEVASSHMARRTFIGNAYKDIKDPNIIGKMSGHVEGSSAFARYRDINVDMLKEVIESRSNRMNKLNK